MKKVSKVKNKDCLKNIFNPLNNFGLSSLEIRRIFLKECRKQKYNVKENSGFIHVRRGDYLQVSSVVTTIDYYKKAMLNVKNNISKWYIFSDDIAWCKQQDTFRNLNPVYVDEKDPVLTLALMCEINGSAIIANSTFSWMGAYLALGANESVIYPLRWIHPGNPDLFPSEWIGI